MFGCPEPPANLPAPIGTQPKRGAQKWGAQEKILGRTHPRNRKMGKHLRNRFPKKAKLVHVAMSVNVRKREAVVAEVTQLRPCFAFNLGGRDLAAQRPDTDHVRVRKIPIGIEQMGDS